ASKVGASAKAVADPSVAAQAEEPPEGKLRRRWHLGAVPSWLVSLVVHVVLIFTLAAITLDPVDKVLSILSAATSQTAESIEQFDLPGAQLDAVVPDSDPLLPPTTEVSE